MKMGRLSKNGKGSDRTEDQEAPREGIRGMSSKIHLQVLGEEDEIRYDRIQEARGRIARKFYDQEDVRKEVTRALLVLFGYRGS